MPQSNQTLQPDNSKRVREESRCEGRLIRINHKEFLKSPDGPGQALWRCNASQTPPSLTEIGLEGPRLFLSDRLVAYGLHGVHRTYVFLFTENADKESIDINAVMKTLNEKLIICGPSNTTIRLFVIRNEVFFFDDFYAEYEFSCEGGYYYVFDGNGRLSRSGNMGGMFSPSRALNNVNLSQYQRSRNSIILFGYAPWTSISSSTVPRFSEFDIATNQRQNLDCPCDLEDVKFMNSTKDGRYLIVIGHFESRKLHYFVYDYKLNRGFKSERSLKKCKGAVMIDDDPATDEILTFGFVNDSFKHKEFRNTQKLSHRLIRLIGRWFCRERVCLMIEDLWFTMVQVDNIIACCNGQAQGE